MVRGLSPAIRAPQDGLIVAASDTSAQRPVVGVVGAGTMGAGIVQVALEAGHRVRLFDVDAAAVERGVERIRAGLSRRATGHEAEGDERTLTARVAGTLERLSVAASLEDVAAGADLVLEAALEDLGTKRAVFAALDEASPSAILATNTSALSVADIAAGARRRDRVLGLHFFNPAPIMALVEVVPTSATDPAVVDAATELVRGWGKTPVRAADLPGFIVNRVNRPFTLEPLAILESGTATVPSIDAAIREAGFPMGPFELMDLVGIDVNLASTRAIHLALAGTADAERFRPSPIQERLVAERRLGRKTGHGFYEYDAEGRSGRPADLWTVGPDTLPAGAIAERVLLAIAAEAVRAAAAGVATPADIDRAMRLGAAHPSGPFELIEATGGMERLSRRLVAHRDLGPRFTVPGSLR